jgi:hypothetical protein
LCVWVEFPSSIARARRVRQGQLAGRGDPRLWKNRGGCETCPCLAGVAGEAEFLIGSGLVHGR